MAYDVPTYEDIETELLYHPSDSQTSTHVFIGASSSGKTTLMWRLWDELFRKSHITIAFLGNPRAKSNEFIYQCIRDGDHIAIFEGYNASALTLLCFIANKLPFRYKFCVIFDDILSIHESKAVDLLMMSLRNRGISTLLSIQHANMLSPAQRSNTNNTWIGGFRLKEQEKLVHKNFVGEDLPIELFHAVTGKHGFIFRDNVRDRPWSIIRLSKDVVEKLEGKMTKKEILEALHPQKHDDSSDSDSDY